MRPRALRCILFQTSWKFRSPLKVLIVRSSKRVTNDEVAVGSIMVLINPTEGEIAWRNSAWRKERSSCVGQSRHGVHRKRARVASGGAVIARRRSPYPEIGVVVQTHWGHIPLLCGPVGTRHHRACSRPILQFLLVSSAHEKEKAVRVSGHSYRWPRIRRSGRHKGSSLSLFFPFSN